MLTHIGRILYWLCSILAAVILLSDLLVACDDEPHGPYSGTILIGYAIIVWLIGWTAAACFLGQPRIRTNGQCAYKARYDDARAGNRHQGPFLC